MEKMRVPKEKINTLNGEATAKKKYDFYSNNNTQPQGIFLVNMSLYGK